MYLRCTMLALVLVLSACSSSSENSSNIVEVEPAGQTETSNDSDSDQVAAVSASGPTGVIYMTASSGDLMAFDPATERTDTAWTHQPDELVAFDVSPAARSNELHVVLTDPGRSIATSLHKLEAGEVSPIDNDFFSSLTICMDQHSAADLSVGHILELTDGTDGSSFVPLVFDGDGFVESGTVTELARPSVVCPRWTADRSVVATAAPVSSGDRSTVLTIIDTADESFQIGITGCSITPTSFSPDDVYLAVDVACYDLSWQASGLYLVDMSTLRNGLNLDDMTKIGDGIFGRSTWHPSGEWIVATVVDVVEDHTPSTNYSQEIFDFMVIDVTTGESQRHQLPGPASAGSFAWMETAFHTS